MNSAVERRRDRIFAPDISIPRTPPQKLQPRTPAPGWGYGLGQCFLFRVKLTYRPNVKPVFREPSNVNSSEVWNVAVSLTATGTHVPYGITQCYLPPGRGDTSAFNLPRAKLVLDLASPEECKAELT